VHHGHAINNSLSGYENVLSCKYKFIGQTNSVLCRPNLSTLDRVTKDRLFKVYCFTVARVEP